MLLNENVLLELTVQYVDVLLLGDLIENILGAIGGQCAFCVSCSCSPREFADIVDRFELRSVGDIPSHYPFNERQSLIDLCLTNRPEKVPFSSKCRMVYLDTI